MGIIKMVEQAKPAKWEKFPFYELKLNSQKADIQIMKNDGMPEDLHYHCTNSLQEALMQPKEQLYEVADAVIRRLVDNTEEKHWLCHIYPAELDIGLSYFRKGSICLGFGLPELRYEARIAVLY